MCEETTYGKDGKHAAASMLEYRVPTFIDSPDVDVFIVESLDPNGPFGAKEASEGPLAGMPAAIAAAVQHATGTTITQLPMTPDRVLEAISSRKKTAARAKPAPTATEKEVA
jgi:4-hydroxybenzoyl-CoA reductase subunit alpha